MQKCSNRAGYLGGLQIHVSCLLGLCCVLSTGLCHRADTQVVTDVSNGRTVLKTFYRKVLSVCSYPDKHLFIYNFLFIHLLILSLIHTFTYFFFLNLPECSNLSGDIQQQRWRGRVATWRGCIQWCTTYENTVWVTGCDYWYCYWTLAKI